jgi:hypothetical protein
MTANTRELESYLASEEELLLSFSAERIEDEDPHRDFSSNADYIFGATDRRILFITSSDEFKDIEYSHISSIETDTDRESPRTALYAGICGGIFIIGGIGSLGDDPLSALFVTLLGGGLLVGGYYLFQDRASTEKITFITGDEAVQQIEATISSDESTNIGAELSRILREQR